MARLLDCHCLPVAPALIWRSSMASEETVKRICLTSRTSGYISGSLSTISGLSRESSIKRFPNAGAGRHKQNYMQRFSTIRLFLCLPVIASLILIVTSCDTTNTKQAVEYTGPLSEAENVELYYSERDKVKIKMMADLAYEFK